MRNLSLMLMLLTAPAMAAAPGEALIGPTPGVLDTALSHDTGDGASPFGQTPEALCSTHQLHRDVATQLPDRPELYTIWDRDKAWGTPEMVEAITAAAEEMAWLMPHADPIIVGDISRRYGGHLSGHKTHRAGIDADLGIFMTGARQTEQGGFVPVTPATLDYEANWLFWQSLLDSGHVDRILLDQRLIDAMRVWTVAEGHLSEEDASYTFPPRGTPRLWARTGVFQHAPNHHHHIHLRVRCGVPAEDAPQG